MLLSVLFIGGKKEKITVNENDLFRSAKMIILGLLQRASMFYSAGLQIRFRLIPVIPSPCMGPLMARRLKTSFDVQVPM